MFAPVELLLTQTSKVIVGFFHPLFPGDFRFPAKNFSGFSNIRLPLQGIIGRKWFVNNLLRGTGELYDLFCEIPDGDLVRIPDIDRIGVITEEQAVNSVDLVVNLTEGAGLGTISKHG